MWSQTRSGILVPHEIPPEWQPVEKAADLLEEMILRIDDPFGTEFDQTFPGSPYAEDRKFNLELAKELAVRAHDLYVLAADHARLALLGLRTPPLAYSPYICARATLELCSTASWLVDTSGGVQPEDRFRRFFDFKVDDFTMNRVQIRKSPSVQEQIKVDSGKSHQDLETMYQAAVQELEEQANSLGIEPIKHGKNPKRPVFSDNPDNPFPNAKANRYFDRGAQHYLFFSAFAHGGPRATSRFWLVRRDIEPSERFHYQPKFAFWMIRLLMSWLRDTSRRISVYAGRDATQIDEELRSYFDEFQELWNTFGKSTDAESPY